ncbi:MAG: hypothetical protein ACTHJ0_13610 [Flavipsychrobacter sp.]
MENNFERNDISVPEKKTDNNPQETESFNIAFHFINPWNNKNETDDSTAPRFYSPLAIYLFSIVFSIIPGAILLSMNIKSKRAKWLVNLYGIAAFIFGAILILGNNTRSLYLVLVCNEDSRVWRL